MIKVSKEYDDVPEALTRTGCKRKIKRAIEAQSGKGYNGHHYKDASVKGKLNDIFKKLSKRKLPIQEYSLWSCHCFDNFSVCFVQKLPPPFQKAIQLAFEAYKKNEL
ncbi:MAG: hypothetical protein ACPGVB_02745 [Chitinophagales bacterium]